MSHKPDIISEENYRDKMRSVVCLTDACKETGEFCGVDGCTLRYSIFRAENAKSNVIIVHGFTEFSEKYREITWYFLGMGYNVFIYDQRGHGYSDRLLPDMFLSHIEKFSDYAKDLSAFVENVVLPNSNGMPIDIFSHSMGGTVALQYLINNDSRIHKAVLSSPMIVPSAGGHLPAFLRFMIKRKYVPKMGWEAMFPHTSRFNPNADFKLSSDMSRERFEYNLDLRRNDEHYQNSAATNRWIYESLSLRKELLDRKSLSGINIPILLFSSGRDNTIRAKYHNTLKKHLKDCTFCFFPDAKHTIYTGTPEQLERYYSALFEFLKD